MIYADSMRMIPILCAGLLVQSAAGQPANQTPSREAESALREGTLAQEHGDLKTAIADFRRALALKPDMVEAHANLGAALAAAGQLSAAIEEDTSALDAAPQNETVRMNLAMAYYRTGDWNQARIEFERLHAAHPADVNTAILLGYTCNKLGRGADTVLLLAPLEPGHEDDFQFEYIYAFALIASGKQDDGLPRMEKLAKAKNSAEAWLVAGSARFYRGQMEIARDDLDAAVALNPKLPGLQTIAGQARYGRGDIDGAILAFEAALRNDPRDFMANLYLGTIRLNQRDLKNAAPLLELALEIRPDWPLARLQMAKLDDIQGRLNEAAEILEDLEKTDPGWLEPHVALAAVYFKMKRQADGDRERGIVQQIEARQQQQGSKTN